MCCQSERLHLGFQYFHVPGVFIDSNVFIHYQSLFPLKQQTNPDLNTGWLPGPITDMQKHKQSSSHIGKFTEIDEDF